MMKTVFRNASILLLIISFGCAGASSASGSLFRPQSTVQAGKGTLYIYRPSSFYNKLIAPTISIDGKPLLALSNNGYTVLNLLPGVHRIETILSERYDGTSKISLNVLSGQSHYVELQTEYKSTMNKYTRTFGLSVIPEAKARQRISSCRHIQLGSEHRHQKSVFVDN